MPAERLRSITFRFSRGDRVRVNGSKGIYRVAQQRYETPEVSGPPDITYRLMCERTGEYLEWWVREAHLSAAARVEYGTARDDDVLLAQEPKSGV